MNYVSLFAGAGGFDIGFDRAGFRCLAQVEIDKTARAVLARHWPDVPRFKDVRHFGKAQVPACDVLIGGFPCQDVSVAGKGEGFGGKRSVLFYEMMRVADELRATYVVWENVPGLRSNDDGRTFLAVLAELDRLGFDGGWGTLDAQQFGVPQSRERVFGVFTRRCSGARDACEILALAPGMRRDTAPRRQAGPGTATVARSGTAEAGGVAAFGGNDTRGERGGNAALSAKGGTGRLDFETETFVVFNPQAAGNQTTIGYRTDGLTGAIGTSQVPGVAGPLLAHSGSAGYRIGADEAAAGHLALCRVAGSQTAGGATPKGREDGLAYCLEARQGRGHGQGQAVVYQCHGSNVGPMGTVRSGNGGLTGGVPFVTDGYFVRRLTPREYERLMGWPDDWTRWRADGTEIKDGPRYRLCGNGVVATVAEWIARRIMRVLKAG